MSMMAYCQPSLLVVRLPPESKAVFPVLLWVDYWCGERQFFSALIAREIGQKNGTIRNNKF